MISPIFMFSRSRNSIVTLSEFYHHRLTSKIKFEKYGQPWSSSTSGSNWIFEITR
jgi:hypothetical protein